MLCYVIVVYEGSPRRAYMHAEEGMNVYSSEVMITLVLSQKVFVPEIFLPFAHDKLLPPLPTKSFCLAREICSRRVFAFCKSHKPVGKTICKGFVGKTLRGKRFVGKNICKGFVGKKLRGKTNSFCPLPTKSLCPRRGFATH